MLTTETLALRYRPRRFEDLVGQPVTRLILAQMVGKKRVPTGLLLAGVPGSGKTSSARILAAALNCTAPADNEPAPCGNCPSCKATFDCSSIDVIEVDAASHGSVAHIRELTESLRYHASGNYRVCILDEAHAMSKEAFYALLKTLEEPPENTVFVLVTTEPHKIIDTILSRLMSFEFRKISTQDIVARLMYIDSKEGFGTESPLLARIAERSNGSLRDAIMTLDQFSRIGIFTLEKYVKLTGEIDFAGDLISEMISGDVSSAFAIVDRELTKHGDPGRIVSPLVSALRSMLVAGSPLVAPETLYKAIRVCWELETKVGLRDPRAALDMLIVVLTETLAGKKNVAQEVKAPEPKKLSFDEMKEL